MKQSLKFQLPVLNQPKKFVDLVSNKDWDLGLIAHCEDGIKKDMKSYFPMRQKIMILIGPEGDFSVSEIELALKHGIKPVTFGENRLRTETAGIIAYSYAALLNEIL